MRNREEIKDVSVKVLEMLDSIDREPAEGDVTPVAGYGHEKDVGGF